MMIIWRRAVFEKHPDARIMLKRAKRKYPACAVLTPVRKECDL
jgi:hypothetical protein